MNVANAGAELVTNAVEKYVLYAGIFDFCPYSLVTCKVSFRTERLFMSIPLLVWINRANEDS